MNSVNFGLAASILLVTLQGQSMANFDTTNKRPNVSNAKPVPKQVLSTDHLRQTYFAFCTHCHGLAGRPTSLI